MYGIWQHGIMTNPVREFEPQPWRVPVVRGVVKSPALDAKQGAAATQREITCIAVPPRSRTLTVHCHQQYCSPLGPGFEVRTVACGTADGSLTYARRGSMETTTACLPYTALICSMAVLPSGTQPRA
jgi:hypothetical protein